MKTKMKLLSITEVAAMHGVTRVAILYAVRDGRIPATRVGSFWVIREEDAENWVPRGYVRSIVESGTGLYPRVKVALED